MFVAKWGEPVQVGDYGEENGLHAGRGRAAADDLGVFQIPSN